MKPYKVGYKKPPIQTRFKPGHSGNKKGRPVRSTQLSLSDVILEELSELQTIEKDGVRIKIPMLRILAKQMIRVAAKGNPRALVMVMDQWEEGLDRKSAKERDEIRAKLPKPDLSKMTTEELTALYFETLKIGRKE